MSGKKICLISGGHISSTPRLIKEADALQTNGYEILVLSTQAIQSISQFDREVENVRQWKVWNLPLYKQSWISKGFAKISRARIQRKLFQDETILLDYAKFVAPWYKEFLAQIECFKPDFIIAHSIVGLLVATLAKKQWGIPFCFDVEDYHAAEREGGLDDFFNRLAFTVMKLCVPEADCVTFSSPQIGGEMQKHFSFERSEVILNCFPLQKLSRKEKGLPLSLYWFSQSIGLDRGLSDILEACKDLRGDFELHLRGGCSASVAQEVLGYAVRGGYKEKVFLDSRCGADELVRESMKHDVGLALERPSPLNRDLCITNKILMYVVAGLGIVATRTQGQRWIMDQMPQAGFIYNPEDFISLTSKLQNWLDNPSLLSEAKEASRHVAEKRFSWEHESLKFLKLVEDCV